MKSASTCGRANAANHVSQGPRRVVHGRAGLLGTLLVALVAGTVSGCAAESLAETDAIEFVGAAIAGAQDLDHVDYCDSFASNADFCEDEREWSTVLPAFAELTCMERLSSQSFAARVTSITAGGEPIRSDIEVVRDGGRVLAVNPVWWVERGIVADELSYHGQPSLLDDCSARN